ncbi:HAMP domain-containing methyl-accepting chemotaxis protein, partial [Rhizobium rhizosphaerae]|uniref:HAMP domain-containing methyl-accepting chemotaxis protein n=1 Tax=Xaviernesmea rhizosphaerae TaxID=1672749 RepID=UPI0018E9B137
MKLSLKAKLGAGFGILILLVAGLGLFSLLQLSAVNDKSSEIAGNWMPSVDLSNRMNTTTSDFRAAELQHVISQDEAGMKLWSEELNKLQAQIDKGRADYVKLIAGPEERALFEAFGAKWDAYVKLHDQAFAYSGRNQTAEAMAIYNGEGLRLYNDASQALLNLVEYNSKGGVSASNEANDIYTSSRMLVLSGIGLCLVLGIAIAVFIMRDILKTLGAEPDHVRDIVTAVAAGDLRLDVHTRANDNSSVLAAVRDMVHRLRGIVGDALAASDNVSSGSQELSSASEQVSQGATEQAS